MEQRTHTNAWMHLRRHRILIGLCPVVLIFFAACGGGSSSANSSQQLLDQLQQQMQQQNAEAQAQYNNLLQQFNALKNNPDCSNAVSSATQTLLGYTQQQQQQQQQQAQILAMSGGGGLGGGVNPLLFQSQSGSSPSDAYALASSITSGVPQGCANAVQNALAAWSHFANGSFANSNTGVQFLAAEGQQILTSLAGNSNIPPQVLAQIAVPLLQQMGLSSSPLFPVVQNLVNAYNSGQAGGGVLAGGSFGLPSGGVSSLTGRGGSTYGGIPSGSAAGGGTSSVTYNEGAGYTNTKVGGASGTSYPGTTAGAGGGATSNFSPYIGNSSPYMGGVGGSVVRVGSQTQNSSSSLSSDFFNSIGNTGVASNQKASRRKEAPAQIPPQQQPSGTKLKFARDPEMPSITVVY